MGGSIRTNIAVPDLLRDKIPQAVVRPAGSVDWVGTAPRRLDPARGVADAFSVGILNALHSWVAGPKRADFYGKAEKVRHVPPAELVVAEAALLGGGPIADRLAAQLREAPDVWRLAAPDGSYELRVSTLIDVRGVPRAGWRSRPIPVRAGRLERDLELEIYVPIAGVAEIHGRTLDGRPWPRTWEIDDAALAGIRSSAPWIDLPTPAEIEERRSLAASVIESWLGEPDILRTKRGEIVAEPPAIPEDLAAFEATQSFRLPASYRDLLLVADGIQVGSLVLLGTVDAYRLDVPGPARLVITPPDEDGAFVLAENGEVRYVDLEAKTSEGRLRARALREWVAKRVRPREKA
jgi:hypothetical protein